MADKPQNAQLSLTYKLILETLLPMALTMLNSEQVRELTDSALDFIEDRVASSPAKWDDKVLLPICKLVRAAYLLPDDND